MADADFGRRLKRRRQAAGYRTQGDLAVKIGVPRSTVGAWENGRQYPQRFIGALESLLGPLDEYEPPAIDPELARRIEELSPQQRDYLILRLTELREAAHGLRARVDALDGQQRSASA